MKLWCYGVNIPPFIGVDVSNLNYGQKILLRDLKLPDGTVTVSNVSLIDTL